VIGTIGVVVADDVAVVGGVVGMVRSAGRGNVELEPPPATVHELASEVIFARVRGPTLPTGLMPFAL
jgi:hypothetical protein